MQQNQGSMQNCDNIIQEWEVDINFSYYENVIQERGVDINFSFLNYIFII